jgi:hypothetical protein
MPTNLASTNLIQVHLISDGKTFDLFSVVTLLLAIGGFIFGLYQYWIGKRWKRIEYIDAVVKRMREDSLLKAACLFLDWEEREIKVGKTLVKYRYEMLKTALRNHYAMKPGEGFTEDEVAIRDAFDVFFDFCSGLQYSVELKMITHTDIFASPVGYYLGKACEKNTATDKSLSEFAKVYGFSRTSSLLVAYQRTVAKSI